MARYALITSLLIMITLTGCSANQSLKRAIPIEYYSNVFGETNISLNLKKDISGGISGLDRLIDSCRNDYYEFEGRELLFWIVVHDSVGDVYFLFHVKNIDDAVIAYKYDSERDIFLYRFSVPMT